QLISDGTVIPSLILADYNLPYEANGIEVIRQLRSISGRHIPAIILTGDITAETLRLLSDEDCLHLPKPVGLGDLLRAIQHLLGAIVPSVDNRPEDEELPAAPPVSDTPTIFILDDDSTTREAL